MPGTFSQIYIQVVFAVRGRENLLQKPWRDDVLKYMGATDHEKPNDVGGELIVGTVKDPWGNIVGLIYNPDFRLQP